MSEFRFYHLQRKSLEAALPELLTKILERGQRVVVLAGSAERVEALNSHLWTFDPASFLPHGSASDGAAAEQPIWLTTVEENPNQATVLVATDGVTVEQPDAFPICCDLFDGNDDEAVMAARDRWKRYKAQGHGLSYWQQGARGGWQKKP
ncbi:MAG: DNA polymerase III subunit chi [Azospirillaceae bacterium]|nr:DNA polymerase III subunit chi [Azospirillaceae bacterium]